jgi:hypothetical protein
MTAIEERVADLVGRMTLDEKVAQLGSAWVFELADGPELDPGRAGDVLGQGIGQITRVSGASSLDAAQAAALANAIQRHLVEDTRLGIPARSCSTPPVAQLGFHGRDLTYVVEPGALDISVGTSSAPTARLAAGTVTVVGDPAPLAKAYTGSVAVATDPA